jgi:transketolase
MDNELLMNFRDPVLTQEKIVFLQEKANWVWEETLLLQKSSPEARVASSLSTVEMLVVLYYGGFVKYDPDNLKWAERDRFIVSKAHGSLARYPIFADLGYFPYGELKRIGQPDSFLSMLPDPSVPGYETLNGTLGHGLGVACGIALALKRNGSGNRVYVMAGDGELHEGACWEAVMFAAHHGLDNIILVVDKNNISMMDYCHNILDIGPLGEKFTAFKWDAMEVDGHDIKEVYAALVDLGNRDSGKPKVLIGDTVKGKGVNSFENDPLCHVKSLQPDEIDALMTAREQ